MRKMLQVDFDSNFSGPQSKEVTSMLTELATSINNEQGMVWKIWTENAKNQLGGGIYLFEDEKSAKNYLDMHSARLIKMGITNIRGVIFDINEPLTEINKGPVK